MRPAFRRRVADDLLLQLSFASRADYAELERRLDDFAARLQLLAERFPAAARASVKQSP